MSHLTRKTSDMDLSIGQAIRLARTAQGISQEKLAAAIGVTFQQIQKYESGRNRVSVSAFVLICKALTINPTDIIGPYFGEKSELNGMIQQIDKLKSQLAAVKAATR